MRLSSKRSMKEKRREMEKEEFGEKEKIEIKSGKKRRSFSLLGRKKECEYCGTELVYKEEYDSYYCPECHDYKESD